MSSALRDPFGRTGCSVWWKECSPRREQEVSTNLPKNHSHVGGCRRASNDEPIWEACPGGACDGRWPT